MFERGEGRKRAGFSSCDFDEREEAKAEGRQGGAKNAETEGERIPNVFICGPVKNGMKNGKNES